MGETHTETLHGDPAEAARVRDDDGYQAWLLEKKIWQAGHQPSLEDLKLLSRFGNITPVLEKFVPDYSRSPELLAAQRDGYKAEARDLLKTLLLPMDRQPIAYSRDQRLQEAREYADLAGTTLEQIAKQENITGVPELAENR